MVESITNEVDSVFCCGTTSTTVFVGWASPFINPASSPVTVTSPSIKKIIN